MNKSVVNALLVGAVWKGASILTLYWLKSGTMLKLIDKNNIKQNFRILVLILGCFYILQNITVNQSCSVFIQKWKIRIPMKV